MANLGIADPRRQKTDAIVKTPTSLQAGRRVSAKGNTVIISATTPTPKRRVAQGRTERPSRYPISQVAADVLALRRITLVEQIASDTPDIALARRKFPRISADGIMLAFPSANYQAIVQDQVERAKLYLGQPRPTKHPRVSSYTLKHLAESRGRYISNGAMITAAIALGLSVRSAGGDFDNNPNCGIGVSRSRRVVKL